MGGRWTWTVGALCYGLALGCSSPTGSSLRTPTTLTLLHTSDLHSHLWPFRARISGREAELGLGGAGELAEVGGLARLGALLQRQRQLGPTLWLDSGDALEGTESFHRYGGRPEVELLGRLGLSAMALGNHELSSDVAALAGLLDRASFPVLSANLEPRAESPLSGRLLPSATLLVDGLRLGVVGVSSPTSPPGLAVTNSWSLELVADTATAVQSAVDRLTGSVDVVVVLSHLGLAGDRELVSRTSGIDLVLGGHQHIVTFEPEWADSCADRLREQRACTARRVPIVHSGAYGKWLSRLELSLVSSLEQPGALDVDGVSLDHLPLAEGVQGLPALEDELAELRPPAQPPLAFSTVPLKRASPFGGDSSLGNFVADALRAALGVEAILLNTSALRADIEAGPVLRSDLELAFPFAEPWHLAWLTGAELLRGLTRAAQRATERGCESTVQVAGLRLRVDCGACAAQSLGCAYVEREGGLPLSETEWLLVGLPAYLTLPGADFAELASRGDEQSADAVEAMAEFVRDSAATSERARCTSLLAAWSSSRCEEAFGELACPLDEASAERVCAGLPAVPGGRDGRIQMWRP